MNVSKYINEILLHRDFIIIPELGGFVCKYQPAKISRDKTTITPPSKNIIFKNDLLHDDGELNQFIQKIQNVDQGKASIFIKDYVTSVKQQLSEGNAVEITEIGELYMDENKQVQFRSALKTNLLLDAFGMSQVNMKPLKNEPPVAITEQKIIIKKTDTNTKKSTNNKDMGTKKKKSTGWIIAIILLAAGIALILIPQYTPYLQQLKIDFTGIEHSLFGKKDKYAVFEDTSKVGKELDSLADKRNALYYEEDKSQIITGDDIPESLISNYKQYNKFYIIAGSYKRYNNAVKLKNILSSQGYKPEILITTEKKLYRVSYKSYTDRREAIKELYRLQKELNNQDIWILNI